MTKARTLGLALAIFAAAAFWLWLSVSIAGGLVGGAGPVVAELIFVLTVYAPLALIGIVGGLAGKARAWSPGVRPGRAAGWGMAIGAAGLSLATLYCAIAGTLGRGDESALSTLILFGLVVIATQVLAEEILFRGCLQPLVVGALGRSAGVVLVAAAFAGLHVVGGASGIVPLLNLLLGGLLFGGLALRGAGIAGAFGAHFAWNAGEQLVLGLDPNPGVGTFGALIDLDLVGRSNWGGSGDGLNASWAMTFALAVMLALVLGRFRQADSNAPAPADAVPDGARSAQ